MTIRTENSLCFNGCLCASAKTPLVFAKRGRKLIEWDFKNFVHCGRAGAITNLQHNVSLSVRSCRVERTTIPGSHSRVVVSVIDSIYQHFHAVY